tara:strand:- start:5947 stop:6339 length:393 start_codon:yes stop_codon:yes gene_type:complete
MAAEAGRLLLIKKGATTIAALRSNSISLNSETVDITTKDDSGWRTLLAAGGVKSASMSGSGVFTDDVSQIALFTDLAAQTLDTYTFEFESGDTLGGTFQCTSIEHAGEYNGEATYSVSFESSGAITYTAA